MAEEKMNDLVRRGDVRAALDRLVLITPKAKLNVLAKAESALLDVNKVDAVEVVRCKDCKHFYQHENIPLCYAEGCFTPMGHDPEKWFCPLGERCRDGRRTDT